ncbi:MAG: class I mannose-6-phosphate isomerase [Kiritimatiellales bacterium]
MHNAVQKKLEAAAPLKFTPNYVWRSYLGGANLRAFRDGHRGEDDHFPEDWLASTVRARNGENRKKADEGLSHLTVDGEDLVFSDLIAEHPDWFWGTQVPPVDEPGQTGVLMKLLDSSVRLHLQAHPDREFVHAHFGGHNGKTECWYILSTRRDDAYVYLGLQHPPAPDVWQRMVEEQDLDGMRACFDKIPVKPGDCLMVPSGVPHAIGEGIFMIELQEPTDWVVRCEFSAGGHVLEHSARFMGLELADVMPMFDFTEYSLGAVRSRLQQAPEVLRSEASFTEERVIGSAHQKVFRLRRFSGSGNAGWMGGEPLFLIALEGEGMLAGEPVRAGEVWLLPGVCKQWNWTAVSKDWKLLLAQPPVK